MYVVAPEDGGRADDLAASTRSSIIIGVVLNECRQDGQNESDPHREGEILSWKEVSAVHRSRNGIYHHRGVLVSLLTDFGKINPPYQDRYRDGGNAISYTGAGRRGDQKPDRFNQAMLDAIETSHDVPLFCKLGVNRWQYLGRWRVESAEYVYDEPQRRMLWKFRLQRCRTGGEDEKVDVR